MNTAPRRSAGSIIVLICIGLVVGALSGLFGVGGGIIIVPALGLLLRYDQRRAAGTSLAAIVPTAVAGVTAYAIEGNVSWIAALILAAGSVVGAQIGSALLQRIPQPTLRWGFVAFIAVVIVSMFLVVPSREAHIDLHWLSIVGLVLLGVCTGILSGLLGVGGGVVIVPMLMLLFGTSDLVAKGTSLLVMVPTAVSGTIGNLRRRNVDILGGVLIGVAACLTTPLGALLAAHVEPRIGNLLFAAFLAAIGVQMAIRAIRSHRRN